jgi:hypothetical protein
VRRLRAIDESQQHPDRLELEDPHVIAGKVLQELSDGGGKRIKIVNLHVYPDWAAYARAIEVLGCCVEAVPPDVAGSVTANLFIEPDGTARLQSVQQQITSPQYTASGVVSPQTIVPFDAIRDSAMSVAASAYRKKLMGYISVDYVIFRKPDTGALRMWAVDLDVRLTTFALMHSLAMLATGAVYDHASGSCVIRGRSNNNETSMMGMSASSNPGEEGAGASSSRLLCYTYSGVLHHPYISALRHSVFFSLCRQRGLSYDVQSRTGVIYHLVDVLLCNCLGFLCVGQTPHQSTSMLLDTVDFLQQQLTAANATNDDALCNVSHMLTAARNMAQKAAAERRRLVGGTATTMTGAAGSKKRGTTS